MSKWMKQLITGVIGMMVIYHIEILKLLHREASPAVAIYSLRAFKTEFISSFIDRTVIDITQLGCPPIADKSVCLQIHVCMSH